MFTVNSDGEMCASPSEPVCTHSDPVLGNHVEKMVGEVKDLSGALSIQSPGALYCSGFPRAPKDGCPFPELNPIAKLRVFVVPPVSHRSIDERALFLLGFVPTPETFNWVPPLLSRSFCTSLIHGICSQFMQTFLWSLYLP